MNLFGALTDALEAAGIEYKLGHYCCHPASKYRGADDLFFGPIAHEDTNGFFIGSYSDGEVARFLVADYEELDDCARAVVEAIKTELGVS